MTFEEKTNRLNEIVELLEKGEVGLDESTKLFEESITLAKELNELLNTQKGKILELKKVVDEFIEEDDADEDGSAAAGVVNAAHAAAMAGMPAIG